MSSVDPIDRAGGGVNRILMLSSSCKGTFTRHVTVRHNQRNIHTSCSCSDPQPMEHSHVMFLFRPTTNGTFTRHVPVQTHNQWNIHTSCSCSDPQPMEHSHVMFLFRPTTNGTFTRHVTVQSQPMEHSHVMLLFSHNQWNIHTSCYCSVTTNQLSLFVVIGYTGSLFTGSTSPPKLQQEHRFQSLTFDSATINR